MLPCRGVRGAVAALLSTGLVLAAEMPRVLWHDPGDVAKIDLGGDAGTGIPAPRPPFTFIKEDLSGTQTKVLVKDGTGRTWDIKFGFEVKPECFTWRIPVAVGYYVEPSYFVASGTIAAIGRITRKSASLQLDGRFKDGRFQIRDATLFKYLNNQTWNWASNPFVGTPELKGLEILIMLASNWDNKDGTSGRGEANTGIFDRAGHQLLYAFTDWGSGMGRWGDKTGQTDWTCPDYTQQTAGFVKGVVNGQVTFSYQGHHNDDFKNGIRPSDVAWLMKYLGQLTELQVRSALRASGANRTEETCFARAIRARIEQLRTVSKR